MQISVRHPSRKPQDHLFRCRCRKAEITAEEDLCDHRGRQEGVIDRPVMIGAIMQESENDRDDPRVVMRLPSARAKAIWCSIGRAVVVFYWL